jgi:hypothetical protein
MKKKKLWQRSRDNIFATIIYGIITFSLTILYEKIIVGLNWQEWMGVRMIYIPIRYVFLFILDYLIDYFRSVLPKAFAEAMALSIYQIPIYIGAALIMGVSRSLIITVCLIYIADNLVFGWLYGYILNRTRKFFYNKL